MVSLKRNNEEVGSALSESQDYYPQTLYLDDEEVGKLGLKNAKLGEERTLVATVRVASVSAHQTEDGDKMDVTLELTAGMVNGSADEKAERLFGGSEKSAS